MTTTRSIWITALFVLPCSAFANTCNQGDLIRQVTVVYADPGQPVPCEVLYEKPMEGQSMTLWRAQNEVGYCEARAAEFLSKLESLGWQCDRAGDSDAEDVTE
ncbi:MAG: hypothetical protein AAF541_14960 [Pseudomonadota bacterium]